MDHELSISEYEIEVDTIPLDSFRVKNIENHLIKNFNSNLNRTIDQLNNTQDIFSEYDMAETSPMKFKMNQTLFDPSDDESLNQTPSDTPAIGSPRSAQDSGEKTPSDEVVM